MSHCYRLSGLLLAAALLGAIPASSQAAGGLNVQTITWDSIGVKSAALDIADGPGSFPVGVRVCNTTGSSISGLKTSFAWDSSNGLISLDGPSSDAIGNLAADGCIDSYYSVQVSKVSSAGETTRKYHITATADGGLSTSTTSGRQLYVEKLQSTNRNSIARIAGPAGCNSSYTSCDTPPSNMQVGKSYTFKLYANSSTSNDQLSTVLTFPGSLFRIQKIRSEYQTPAGAMVEGPYADACGWQSRACAGPIIDPFKPNGKAGGLVTTTYTVTPTAVGSGDLHGLMTNVYSGNFYYNSDYSDSKLFSHYTIRYPLDVKVDGQGQVSSDVGGIKCGLGQMVCSASFDSSSLVTLQATADKYQEFKGWSGDGCSGSSSTCKLTMDKARAVEAKFAGKTQFPLSIKISGQGTIASEPFGISCNPNGGPSCSAQFNQGVSVELTPIAISGWRFTGWSGSGCSGTVNCFISMDQAKAVQATFELIPPPSFTVTIDPSPKGGSVLSQSKPDNNLQINCGQVCTSSYPFDASLDLTPEANAGYQFVKWSGCDQSGDFVTIDHICQMSVTSDRTVAAVFQAVPRYDVNAGVIGQGSLSSNPAGIDCQDKCSSSFQQDTLVTLVAKAADDWQFDHWQGDCIGQGECQIKTNQNVSVQAVFAPIKHKLQIGITGEGIVKSVVAGIDCGLQCQADYNQGSVVGLQATPKDGWRITGWSGDCQANSSVCLLDMNQDRNTQIEFEKIPSYRVDLGITGSGSIQGLGLDCPDKCSNSFLEGAPLELTAVASPEWKFDHWSGDCSGTGECLVSVDQSKKVQANFVPVRYQLQIKNTGHGSISADGIDCGDNCQADYASGTKVTLSAKADEGYRLAAWSNSCDKQQDCALEMTQDTAIKVAFEKIPDYGLSLATKGSGTVRDDSGQIDCPSRCVASYREAQTVRLEASARPEWRFKEWTGACSGS